MLLLFGFGGNEYPKVEVAGIVVCVVDDDYSTPNHQFTVQSQSVHGSFRPSPWDLPSQRLLLPAAPA